MTRTVTIDGGEVLFRASAAVPRLYRIKFKRDILVDMKAINEAIQASGAEASTIPPKALTLFENVAYIMAKHADKDHVPDDPDKWLDGFETFSIYAVFPVIQEMWADNLAQLNQPQKK